MCSNIVSPSGHNMAKNAEIIKKRRIKVSHEDIAYTVGASKSTVKAIRIGGRSQETETGQRVMIAEMLIEEGTNKLLEEVKRIVQIPSPASK